MTVQTQERTATRQNVLLAGVGGQGILTIAQAISGAALARGKHVKQAEVHGMAQRGGGVQSHLRISDREIHSDLIPAGHADLLIAVEPLESLRYVHYLAESGTLVSSVNAFVNIGNYPPVESVLDRIAAHPRHVLIDAERIARAAGSGRAANLAILGAASLFLELETVELEAAIGEMFAAKGDAVVEVNRRAFRFGRSAAAAYLDGLNRGGTSAAVRHWIETLGAEHLAEPERPDAPVFDVVNVEDRLSGAEAHAVERSLQRVHDEGRTQLFEHEVYSIVQLVGAISPPHHVFLSTEEMISEEELARVPGDRVVLKIVSPDIVHKTEAAGIAFVPKDHDTVRREIDRLIARHRDHADVRGVLVVECVERVRPGFGNELFVGIRSTREFGPVIAAGIGGIDTEYLAGKMKPGLAVAKAPALDITAEQFLELFRSTVAYEILSGRARGRSRIVSDGELLRCFRAFLLLAQRFCVDRGEEGPDVAELEVNPFAFRQQRLVPLDGRGRLGTAARALPARPAEGIRRLLEPESIAILGVSATARNAGRIILGNVIECGFPRDRVRVVKEGVEEIDGVRCVPGVAALPGRVDLLVIAAAATQLPALVRQAAEHGGIHAAIAIPGGVGETEGTADIAADVRQAVAEARGSGRGGLVLLGPNSLGAVSRPGGYDTLFIPADRLDKRWGAPARPVAILSQSGAFIVSRMSNLESLDPAFAVSLGNQLDLTASDFVAAIGERDDVHTMGVYVEGFGDLDGLELARNVADTFKEFEQMLELCTALHDKKAPGVRLGVVSNAGFETVGMADAIQGQRYRVEMASLSERSTERLAAVLRDHGLGSLVNARNPLDVTPMAGEDAYEGAVRVMLESDDVDAVVVGVVPLTAALAALPGQLEEPRSLARRLPALFAESRKPLIAVVDSGPRYLPFARALRLGGVPVFPSADQAVRSLGRYLCHRAGQDRAPGTARPAGG
jgi:indolepyruvate ferredoxin oxidoreductase beta subunit